MPSETETEGSRLRLAPIALAAWVACFLAHLWAVRRHAVDVPFWDEWELLAPDGLGQGVRLAWLLQQANEHRIPLTRLHIGLQYQLDGWNVATTITLNFVLWGGVVAAVAALLARRAGLAVGAGFTLLLLSPLGQENHSWAYQSCFHLSIGGALVAALALDRAELGWRRAALAAAGLVVAICGMTAGLILSACLVAALLVHPAALAAVRDPTTRATQLARLALVVAPWAALVALWAAFRNPGPFPAASPLSGRCWAFFLDLVALGFGVTTPSVLAGLIALAAPLAGLALAARVTRDRAALVVTGGLLAGVLANLFAVAVGRAEAFPDHNKQSKYWEVACLLVPLTAAAWHQALAPWPRRRAAVLTGLWAIVFLAYADDWTLEGYRRGQQRRLDGLRRVAEYYRSGAPRRCPELYYGELAPRLDEARRLDLSFTRRLAPR